MQNNQITIKDLYVCNEQLYKLFKHLVTFIRDSEPVERLDILDKFFLTYKYPKLEEFAGNIECHNGEDGPHYANIFLRNNYELFLKENDPELYSIFCNAEDIYCNQNGLKYILEVKDLKEPEPNIARNPADELPF